MYNLGKYFAEQRCSEIAGLQTKTCYKHIGAKLMHLRAVMWCLRRTLLKCLKREAGTKVDQMIGRHTASDTSILQGGALSQLFCVDWRGFAVLAVA